MDQNNQIRLFRPKWTICGPFWSRECQNPVRNKVMLTKMVVLTILGHLDPVHLPTVPRPLLKLSWKRCRCQAKLVVDSSCARRPTMCRILPWRYLRLCIRCRSISVFIGGTALGHGTEVSRWYYSSCQGTHDGGALRHIRELHDGWQHWQPSALCSDRSTILHSVWLSVNSPALILSKNSRVSWLKLPWAGKSCFSNRALVEAIFEASKCL